MAPLIHTRRMIGSCRRDGSCKRMHDNWLTMAPPIQTCRNSWSSIGYSNLYAKFPGRDMEPDWDLIRRRRVEDLESCLCHGPYFHRKAERIHGLLEVRSRRISRRIAFGNCTIPRPSSPLQRAFADSPDGDTSLERLYSWPTEAVRTYLMSISGATWTLRDPPCTRRCTVCPADAPEMHPRCTGDAPEMRRRCTGDAPEMRRDIPQIVEHAPRCLWQVGRVPVVVPHGSRRFRGGRECAAHHDAPWLS